MKTKLNSHELTCIRKLMLNSDVFLSNEFVRKFWEKLPAWKYSMPESTDKASRVDAIIAFGIDKKTTGGETCLYLLLKLIGFDGIDLIFKGE